MLAHIQSIKNLVKHTKLHKLNFSGKQLYTKLEFQNIFGSIKDRPAFFIIYKAIEEGKINSGTIVIESTSGNFGIALAHICKLIGVRFIAVIDPNISVQKEKILSLLCYKILKVSEKDETGGYLMTRIKTVKDFINSNRNVFHPNQYENKDNGLAYYETLGAEICDSFLRLDYLFVSVSSGGTIIGLSNKLKEKFQDVKIVAIDVHGSMIFSDKPSKRTISGIGASMRSPLLDHAIIDEVVILSEVDIVKGCYELLNDHSLFLGASAGAAYAGAKKILALEKDSDTVALFISPDHGSHYIDSIYSEEWVNKNIITDKLNVIDEISKLG